MTDAKSRAARAALKSNRAREASRAMLEHDAQRRAVLAKTARLRALRLAHEAGSVVVSAKTPVEKQ